MLDLATQFELLCKALFLDSGYQIAPDSAASWGADIYATSAGENILAEVKWTHRPTVYGRLLRNWVPTAAKLQAAPGTRILVLVSGTVSPESRSWAEREFGIEIWDRRDLLSRAVGEDTRKALTEFFLLSDDWTVRASTDPEQLARGRILHACLAERDLSASEKPPGEKLIGRLRQMPRGVEYAKRYEGLCTEIIDFLFGDTLVNPIPQCWTDDDLSILDIVYRVSPAGKSVFWQTISRDFRARTIVFECKNYTDAIGPMQVYTTERYMSLRALRSVCVILTRDKPKPNAFTAAQAAMRDSGKLIVFLDDNDLETMLTLRASQLKRNTDSEEWIEQDPAEIVDHKIYEVLAKMPR